MLYNSSVAIQTKATINSNSVKIIKNTGGIISNSATNTIAYKIINGTSNVISNSSSGVSAKKFFTGKAIITSISKVQSYVFEREFRRELKAYLPTFLTDSSVLSYTLDTKANEFTKYNCLINDLFNQLRANTLTEWGIEFWESILQLVPVGDLDNRKNNIKYRLEVSSKPITLQLLTEIVSRYCTSNITEDFINSKISIKCLEERGRPKYIDAMINDTEKFIPAHVNYEYIFTYLPWDELEQSKLTWNEVEEYTWDNLLTSFLV